MTRLTLHWHLRGIVEGTTEGEVVRVDITPGSGYKRREWSITKRYYCDPTDEDRKRVYEEQANGGSYTTGFTRDSGDFCDAFNEHLARQALASDDAVLYLDRAARDPARTVDERNDAADLLTYHIYPNAPDAGDLGRSESLVGHADRPDIDFNEWVTAGMTGRKRHGTRCWPLTCPTCHHAEEFWDFEPVDAGVAHEPALRCPGCGWEPPEVEVTA